MNRMKQITIVLVLLGALAGPGVTGDWTCITIDLWNRIPDYEDGPNHFVRKCGSLLVHPTNGKLFLLVSPKYGIWQSADHGQTWKRSDDNVVSGRTWGGDGAKFDPTDFERMVFFTIVGRGATPIGGLSLDGGKTWKALHRPKGMRHDGWTSGQVDWSDKTPTTVFAKQHHTENLWLSEDFGENWTKAMPEGGAYKLGMIGDDVLLASAKGKVAAILRSTDKGKTWSPVSEPVFLQQRSPHVYGDHAYWAIPNALLATFDRGKTWKPIGPIVKDVAKGEQPRTWGPIFGRSEKEMLVAVNGHGYFRSTDAGKSWTKIADWMDKATPFDAAREAFSIGWDLENRLVYCAFLGGEAYRSQWLTDKSAN